jgi:ribonuclease J
MSFNFKKHNDQLLFVPLGGCNEIGMNLNLYRYQGKWLMVDCGMGFADEYLPGIDILFPNIDALIPHKEDLLGLVLTHAHEDHIGAVQYLWPDFECPLYATPFTAAMLKPKLAEDGLGKRVKIHEVNAGKSFDLGPLSIEMIPLTHSIPEMHAIAISTDKGVVMHTGDWKLDSNPQVGVTTDEKTLQKYGDAGVLAMVCDSTNVFVEGESGSEGDVRTQLANMVAPCENRVVVTTFASNIARISSIIHAAESAGRRVAMAGRSLWRVTGAAQESGYLKDIQPFLTDTQGMQLPKDKVLFICTGCQGEGRAALSKIARGDHPAIRLSPNDTVIFSSRTIPGNELSIAYTQNRLVEQGIEIIADHNAMIHVSGHPARMELERMYQLVQPQIAVPVHGEQRHIHEHARFAKNLQVPHTIEPFNGAVIALDAGNPQVLGRVDSGYIALDGRSMIDKDASVIRTRRKLRDQGYMLCSFSLNKQGTLASDILLSAPGCLDIEDDKAIIDAIIEEVTAALDGWDGRNMKQLENSVRAAMRRTIRQELGKNPVLSVHVHQL